MKWKHDKLELPNGNWNIVHQGGRVYTYTVAAQASADEIVKALGDQYGIRPKDCYVPVLQSALITEVLVNANTVLRRISEARIGKQALREPVDVVKKPGLEPAKPQAIWGTRIGKQALGEPIVVVKSRAKETI